MPKVRQALLSDVQGISLVYRSLVKQWTRPGPEGPLPAPYEALSLHERWLHGGPWLSLETCAIWLGHLLQQNEGLAIVAEEGGQILGEAEVFISREAPPYGHHLNISNLNVLAEAQGQGVGRALVDYILEMARALKCQQITVAYPNPLPFWEALGFQPLVARRRVTLPAKEGRVFYKAHELQNDSPKQVAGWYMSLGRFQNSREEWERFYWMMWAGVPQLVEPRWHGLSLELSGQPCLLHLHQREDDPQGATARVWTKYELSTHVISAICDRAARLNYAYISSLVDEPQHKLLTEAQDLSEPQWLYSRAT